MISVTIKGFKDINHAREFVDWYEGQGEQDSEEWLDINEQPSCYVDMNKPYEITKDNITFYLREDLHEEDDEEIGL